MNDRDKQSLLLIRKYCMQIFAARERFGNSLDAFRADDAFYDAMAMKLFQVGELAAKLSPELASASENRVPWRGLRSLRNLLASEYEAVVTPKLWSVITEDIPALLSFCDEVIAENDISSVPDDSFPWNSVREGISNALRLF